MFFLLRPFIVRRNSTDSWHCQQFFISHSFCLLWDYSIVWSFYCFNEIIRASNVIFGFIVQRMYMSWLVASVPAIGPQSTIFMRNTVHLVPIQAEVLDCQWIVHPQFKYQVTLGIKAIKVTTTTDWQPYSSTMQIYMRGRLRALVADHIQIDTLVFKKPTSSSYLLYLMKEGIIATHCVTHLPCTVIYRPSWSIKKTLNALRLRILRSLKSSLIKKLSHWSPIFLGKFV